MKKVLSILLSLIILTGMFAAMPLTAMGAEYSGYFRYEILDDGTAEITGYSGKATELEIPNNLDGYIVTSIGSLAFCYCTSLENVIIPNSVTSIGNQAFYYCTSLTSITIPDSVTNIEWGAFSNTAYCNNRANWENNVLYIGNHLIDAKGDITGSYQIKDGTITIAGDAFSFCRNLASVTIPDSVTSIIDEAFYYCKSLEIITVNSNNRNYSSKDGVLFNKDKTELIQYPIANNRTSYKIPNSVTSIDSRAFSDCPSLASITIPDSVTSIGTGAFYYCTNLKSIKIPNSVTSIEEFAFSDCTSLSDITIPNSVINIGRCAFQSCTSLKDVYYLGDESLWNSIIIDDYNECLTDANIHFLNSILGDVDRDGEVGIMDATLIQMYLAKLRTLDEQQLIIADSDASGSVDILDATTIQMFLAKLINHLGK